MNSKSVNVSTIKFNYHYNDMKLFSLLNPMITTLSYGFIYTEDNLMITTLNHGSTDYDDNLMITTLSHGGTYYDDNLMITTLSN